MQTHRLSLFSRSVRCVFPTAISPTVCLSERLSHNGPFRCRKREFIPDCALSLFLYLFPAHLYTLSVFASAHAHCQHGTELNLANIWDLRSLQGNIRISWEALECLASDQTEERTVRVKWVVLAAQNEVKLLFRKPFPHSSV